MRYKTRFQHIWQEKWPFVTVVRGDPYSFRCAVCNKLVSCCHQGEKDVSHHYDSSQHKKNVVALANTQMLNFRPSASVQSQKEKVRSQCFNVCCIAARKHCYYRYWFYCLMKFSRQHMLEVIYTCLLFTALL